MVWYQRGYLIVNGSGLNSTRFWTIFSLFFNLTFLPYYYPTSLPNTICKKGQDLKRDREEHKREKENTKTEMQEKGGNVVYSIKS